MFVVSVKSSKIKMILAVIFILLVFAIAFFIFGKEYSSAVIADGAVSLRASNEKERISFLSQFGWDFDTEPTEVKEVIIPAEFDETYNKYNEMQKSQGLDLEKYKGTLAKQWTYNVNNYPGYEDKEGYVEANLLIYNGNVIAADITVLGKNPQFYTVEFPQRKAENVTET